MSVLQHYNTQILAYNRVSGTCRIIEMSSIRYNILSVVQIVFAGLVWSSLLTLRDMDRDLDRSTVTIKGKRT